MSTAKLAPAPVDITDDDLRALREAVAAFVVATGGEHAVRAVMESDSPVDAEGWTLLVGQLGLTGLVVDEQNGGSNAGFAALGVVLEELGRTLYPSPLLATSLAAWAIQHSARAASNTETLRSLATGGRRGAVVCGGPKIRLDAGALTGRATAVLDAEGADLLVVATTADESGLVLVDDVGAAIQVTPRPGIDPLRPLADVTFDGAVCTPLGGASEVARLRAVSAVAIACEQVGGASAALASAVDYAKVRSQFGRLIGGFQSVKHRCADVLLDVESGRAAVQRAVRAIDDDDQELEVLASVAKAWCSAAYVRAAETSLQIHGGIGFTWEHSAHLHLKRAKTNELLFGDARHHREHLADLLGL